MIVSEDVEADDELFYIGTGLCVLIQNAERSQYFPGSYCPSGASWPSEIHCYIRHCQLGAWKLEASSSDGRV